MKDYYHAYKYYKRAYKALKGGAVLDQGEKDRLNHIISSEKKILNTGLQGRHSSPFVDLYKELAMLQLKQYENLVDSGKIDQDTKNSIEEFKVTTTATSMMETYMKTSDLSILTPDQISSLLDQTNQAIERRSSTDLQNPESRSRWYTVQSGDEDWIGKALVAFKARLEQEQAR